MKKTLAILLAALAMTATAEDITLSQTQHDTQGGYVAFDFALTNSWLTATPAGSSISDEVLLNTMTVTVGRTWYTQTNGTVVLGAAVYEKNNSGTWDYVGKSDWVSHTLGTAAGTTNTIANPDISFDFSGLNLQSATTYTMVFYGHENSFNNLAEGSSLTTSSLVGGSSSSSSSPLAAVGLHVSGKTSSEIATTMYAASPNGTYGTYTDRAPVVSFEVQNVPEPATATLSLLALAGLAARRRRK